MNLAELLRNLPSPDTIRSLPYRDRHAEMRQAITALADAAEEITARAKASGRDLLASEQRDFDRINDAVRDLEQADRSARLAEQEANRATAPTAPDAYRRGVPLTRNQTFSGYLRSASAMRGSEDGVDERLSLPKLLRGIATGQWNGADAERRVMATSPASAGGYLIPATVLGELIDLARPQTACLAAGARLLPMETAKVTVPKWLSDPTATWRAENAEITASTPTMGAMILEARSLASLVTVSRELIEDSGTDVGNALAQAFAKAFAAKLDAAALRGAGTDEPTGILHTVTPTVLATDGATPTWDHLLATVGTLQDANETPNAWISAPRTARSLEAQRTATDGQYLTAPPSVAALGKHTTTAVPTNLTVGQATTQCSELYVGDFTQMVIGVRTNLAVKPLVERYAEFGQIGFLAWYRADVAVTRASAFAVRTGVKA